MLKLLIGADIVMIGTFLLRFPRLPPQIPLYYSKFWGESQLADLWMIFILPIFMNSLYFINGKILNKFYSTNELIKNIFYYFNIFIIVSFTLIFIKIIFMVS